MTIPTEYEPAPSTMMTPADFTQFPWMQYALQEFGEREIPGRRHNPRIVEYFTAVGGSIRDDETAWCSAFANWVVQQAGLEGTRRANARSWMTWGQAVPSDAPQYGAITVLWRESRRSWKGHVGFFVGMEQGNLVLLGGNQGNAVSFRRYPSSRLLGYRWPSSYPQPNVCVPV